MKAAIEGTEQNTNRSGGLRSLWNKSKVFCVCADGGERGSGHASYSLLTPPHAHRRCTLLFSHNHWCKTRRGFEEQRRVLCERLISGATHPNKSWNKLTVLQYKRPTSLQSGGLTEIRDFGSDTLFSLVDDFKIHERRLKKRRRKRRNSLEANYYVYLVISIYTDSRSSFLQVGEI